MLYIPIMNCVALKNEALVTENVKIVAVCLCLLLLSWILHLYIYNPEVTLRACRQHTMGMSIFPYIFSKVKNYKKYSFHTMFSDVWYSIVHTTTYIDDFILPFPLLWKKFLMPFHENLHCQHWDLHDTKTWETHIPDAFILPLNLIFEMEDIMKEQNFKEKYNLSHEFLSWFILHEFQRF